MTVFVGVFVGVIELVGVFVGVTVLVTLGVTVFVGVFVGVTVLVTLGVIVLVGVGVGVSVSVGVGVGVSASQFTLFEHKPLSLIIISSGIQSIANGMSLEQIFVLVPAAIGSVCGFPSQSVYCTWQGFAPTLSIVKQ